MNCYCLTNARQFVYLNVINEGIENIFCEKATYRIILPVITCVNNQNKSRPVFPE